MIYSKVGRAREVFQIVCVLGILLGLGASVQAEPIYNPNNGHYYERYDPQPGLGYTWQDAHALVDGAMGTLYYQGVLGDLVGVETQGEHDWLVQNLSTASGLLGYWTGGWQHNPSESIATDPNAYARNWDWAGGGAFGAWTNWGPGQPDDGGVFGGYEDNLIYWNDNKWNDLGGGETYVMQNDIRTDFGFIVEFEAPSLMGDVNLDGFVDDDDMSLLLANWGTGNEWGLGDFNSDNTVDDDDLSLLLANWNEGSPPPMAGDPVPEPATMLMLGIGGVGALLRRKR